MHSSSNRLRRPRGVRSPSSDRALLVSVREVRLGMDLLRVVEMWAMRLLASRRDSRRLRRGKFWRWVRALSVRSIESCWSCKWYEGET